MFPIPIIMIKVIPELIKLTACAGASWYLAKEMTKQEVLLVECDGQGSALDEGETSESERKEGERESDEESSKLEESETSESEWEEQERERKRQKKRKKQERYKRRQRRTERAIKDMKEEEREKERERKLERAYKDIKKKERYKRRQRRIERAIKDMKEEEREKERERKLERAYKDIKKKEREKERERKFERAYKDMKEQERDKRRKRRIKRAIKDMKEEERENEMIKREIIQKEMCRRELEWKLALVIFKEWVEKERKETAQRETEQESEKQEECKKNEQQANRQKEKRDTCGLISSGSSQPPNQDNNKDRKEKNEPNFFEALIALLRRILKNVYGNEAEPFSRIFENLSKEQRKYLSRVLKPLQRFGTLEVVVEIVLKMFKKTLCRHVSFGVFLSLLEFVQTYIADELLERTLVSSGTDTAMKPNERREKIIFEIASENDIVEQLQDLLQKLITEIEVETAAWHPALPNFRDYFAAVYHYLKHKRLPDNGRILSVKEYFAWIKKCLEKFMQTQTFTEINDVYVYEIFVPMFRRRFRIVLKRHGDKIVLSSGYVVTEKNPDDEDKHTPFS